FNSIGGCRMRVNMILPDGTKLEVERGTTVEDIAGTIGPGLKKRAVAARLDDRLIDLSHAVVEDGRLEIVTLDSPDGLAVYRHSAAHVMAQALKRLYGG